MPTRVNDMTRGLSISEAAVYCGVTPGAYRNWMRQGLVPGFWAGTRRIDRRELDDALDRMSGRNVKAVKPSKFDAWKSGNAAT